MESNKDMVSSFSSLRVFFKTHPHKVRYLYFTCSDKKFQDVVRCLDEWEGGGE